MQMKSDVGDEKPWNILRLLLWSRKGVEFRRRMVRLFPKLFLKSLGCCCSTTEHREMPYVGAYEFSFGETPIIHVNMYRPPSMRFRMPRTPCLNNNPQLDFDYDEYQFDDDSDDDDVISYCNDGARKSFLVVGDEDKDEDDNGCRVSEEEDDQEENEGIDIKAEQFIAKFYEQMKLER